MMKPAIARRKFVKDIVVAGMRMGSCAYGGTVFGNKGTLALEPYTGYQPFLVQIIRIF